MISRRVLIVGIAAAAAVPAFSAVPERSAIMLMTADGRKCEVTVWRTIGRRKGRILFSHGALSAPWKYEALLQPWVAAGYDVFAPLHVDSSDHPDTGSYKGLASWGARIEDMRAVARYIDGKHYIAAGHSYGALVALTLGGAAAVSPEGVKAPLRDRKAKAVIAFSPPGIAPGLIDGPGYTQLAVPAFIQTGDKDIPPGSGPDGWQQHMLAYDMAVAGGDRYGLILSGVDHYFGGIICRPELPGPKQSEQFDTASRLSTGFLKAYGSGNRIEKRALQRQLGDAGPFLLQRK